MVVLDDLKKRFEAFKASWVEELENILWAITTTPKIAIEETPFSLVYGSESMAPCEIAVPTIGLDILMKG